MGTQGFESVYNHSLPHERFTIVVSNHFYVCFIIFYNTKKRMMIQGTGNKRTLPLGIHMGWPCYK
jgi:hypothetical protein